MRRVVPVLSMVVAVGLIAGDAITSAAIQHASVHIEHAGKLIQVNPAQGDL